jgi:hypothetical protein
VGKDGRPPIKWAETNEKGRKRLSAVGILVVSVIAAGLVLVVVVLVLVLVVVIVTSTFLGACYGLLFSNSIR